MSNNKQITIEEAAEKHINDDLDLYESLVDGHISYNVGIDLLNKLFKDGAKWQAERMYSEEEVRKILWEYIKPQSTSEGILLDGFLEQFKKKQQ